MRPEFPDRSRRGPGQDALGGVVPVGMFLLQSERLVVGLSHVIAYPTGCTLEIGETSLDGDSLDVFDRMVFTARFGAVTARLYDKTAPRSTADGEPALMLTESGGERTSGRGRADGIRRLWRPRCRRPSQDRCRSCPRTLARSWAVARWMVPRSWPRAAARSPTGGPEPRRLTRR